MSKSQEQKIIYSPLIHIPDLPINTLMIPCILAFLSFSLLVHSCQISGRQIGYCSPNPLNQTSFCSAQVGPYICIPAHNTTWSQYDAFYKDSVVQSVVLGYLQQQLISQYLQQSSALQISNNPSCYQMYKQFACNWNFPACNTQTNKSIVMCQSICNNFQNACGGITDACSIIYAKTDLGLDSSC